MFEAGNRAAVKHGAQATLALAPRAEELAAELRREIPGFSSADETAVKLLALLLARIERAHEWVAEQPSLVSGKRGEPLPLLKLLSSWEAQALRLLKELGLTPAARGALGADVAAGRASLALEEHLRRTYGEVVEGE